MSDDFKFGMEHVLNWKGQLPKLLDECDGWPDWKQRIISKALLVAFSQTIEMLVKGIEKKAQPATAGNVGP